jgi:hypothetical protein
VNEGGGGYGEFDELDATRVEVVERKERVRVGKMKPDRKKIVLSEDAKKEVILRIWDAAEDVANSARDVIEEDEIVEIVNRSRINRRRRVSPQRIENSIRR